MKKILIAMLALLLAVCMAIPAMAENTQTASAPAAEASVEPTATPEPQPVEVPATVILAYKDGSINVRAEDNTDSDIVTSLNHEDKITVILYGEIWSRIRTKSGKGGYIKNVYIDDGNPIYAAGTEYFGTARKVTVTEETPMYAGASAESAQITTLLVSDVEMTALGVNGDFTLIATPDGAQGYAATQCLSQD